MSKVERFEDLRCWQSARRLVKEVYLASEGGKLGKDFPIRDQLRRAALSVMNNIAEGFGKFSSKDFIRFLDISQSSALEVRSILYVVLDLNYLSEEKIHELMSLADETRNLSLALIKYLRSKR